MPFHVLVTGAGGFSGASMTVALLSRGYRVTALLGSTRGALQSDAEARGDLAVLTGDLSTGLKLPADIDAIVHAAARSAWPGVSTDELVRSNVIGTRNLIRHGLNTGVSTFILFSSLSVHGTIQTAIVDQSTPVMNPQTYGLTKYLCEQMLAAVSGSMRGLAMRLPGVLGPGSVRNWMTTSLAAAREGRDITVFDPDAPFNNAVHIGDIANFVDGLIKRDWDGFVAGPLGAAGQTTAGAVAQLLSKAGGRGSRVRVDPSPRQSYTISSDWASQGYGYAPMDISAMLQRFVAENPATGVPL